MEEDENDYIEIPLSKTKIVLLSIGAIVFVAAGFWLWSIADNQNRYDSTMVRLIAGFNLMFFTMCGIIGFGKLFDTKPGVVINHIGITDNSSAVGGYTIKWDDITDISMQEVKRTKFILIYVKNPHEYINHANLFKKFWMNLNHRVYGTPLSITATTLTCNITYLVKLITEQRKRHTS